MAYTETEIRGIVDRQKKYFRTGETLPVSFRIEQLKKLKTAVLAHEKDFEEALHKDLGRSTVPLREHPYSGSGEALKMKLLRLFER